MSSRVDPTDIGFIIGTSFGNGYRLTGDPSYQSVLVTAGGSLASLYNSKVGAVQSWNFPPNHPFQVIIDSMMTLGPLQWGATAIGGNPAWAGMAANHTETVTSTLVRARRQHGRGRHLQHDERVAGGRDDVRRIFQYLDLGARGGLGLVWIRAGLSDVG